MAKFNSETDLPALKSELTLDPVGQGYAASNNFNVLAKMINYDSASGATKSTDNFTGEDIMEACLASPAEYDALITTDIRSEFMRYLFGARNDRVSVRFKNELMTLFSVANAPLIRAALIAAVTGPQSRAEELWADDDIITAKHIENALALP